MMEEALVARLLAAPAIVAIAGDRVNWIERAASYPALTLQMITSGRNYKFKGAMQLHRPRIQFDSWAETYGEAKLLKRATLAVVEPAGDVAGVRFSQSFLMSERDLPFETAPDGQKAFRISFDMFVWWNPL